MFIKNIHTGHTLTITASERDYLLAGGDIYRSNEFGVYYPDEHDWEYIVRRVYALRGN